MIKKILILFFFSILFKASYSLSNFSDRDSLFTLQIYSPPKKEIGHSKLQRRTLPLFATERFVVGFRIGMNVTKPGIIAQYSVFSNSEIEIEGALKKEYFSMFDNKGGQFGMMGLYTIAKGFYVGIFPTYTAINYNYKNTYTWVSNQNSSSGLEAEYNYKNLLKYIEIPLMFKYEFMKGKFQPYAQVGVSYARLINAYKKVDIKETLKVFEGGNNDFSKTKSYGTTEMFIGSNFSVCGGVGVSYYVGNLKLALEVDYSYGFINTINESNRFSNQQIVIESLDIQDDVKLSSLQFNLAVIIPLLCI